MHRDVLGDMYGAVETLINWVKFNGVRVSVVFFADRYQNPIKGGYKDHDPCLGRLSRKADKGHIVMI